MNIVVTPAAPVCAIPPITVVPSGNYKMPIVKPERISRTEIADIGVPGCDPKFFQK